MDETTKWLLTVAQQQQTQARTYEQAAFYQALQTFIRQQALRLEQAEAEVDGRTWDHSRW